MKSKLKKFFAGVFFVATVCSVSVVSVGALTRRLYGDVNNDGIISEADVHLILENAVQNVEFDKYQTIAADVNGDGCVTASDAQLVMRLVVGAIDRFPVGDYFVY